MSAAAVSLPIIATGDFVEFDAETHTYTYGGRPTPNVTRILEDLGIIDYSKIPPSTREMALARGAFNHEAIAADLVGDLDESSVPDEWAGYLGAARQFCRDTRFEPALIEQRFAHPTLRYAGTLDTAGLATITVGGRAARRRALIDWKTGTAEPWVAVQTVAYAGFLQDPATYYRICVELHADATYRLYTFGPERWAKDWQRWSAYLTTYRDRTELTW